MIRLLADLVCLICGGIDHGSTSCPHLWDFGGDR